ncbi:sodium-dependent phosphate transport protein 2B-like [Ixodes scapularis]|uniref:sodium-dependent phosphate transport protein 2B-like n=1 Tax=Ixodes scapularis TaxID=6945 RepID=UPI001C38E93B|nr:sodium-dependent phosphate transport protein 2B-like [Ixodes scapularis]
MAALPEALQPLNNPSPVINIAIYADDVALWATAPTSSYIPSLTKKRLCAHLTVLALSILAFLVALDLLGDAFKLVGGRAASHVLSDSSVLINPVVGLMVGVLVTVLMQSSSSSTSITVSMVGSNLLTVRHAVPIIMGANVGTSVTNTMVSLMHIKRREEFRRGFAAATIHDVFNWLNVILLLPCEVAFHLLESISGEFVVIVDKGQNMKKAEYLSAVTKPIVKLIVQLDKDVLKDIVLGHPTNSSLLKECCKKEGDECIKRCVALFNWLNMGDTVTGALLLVLSVACILLCFFLIVKMLTQLTKTHIVKRLTAFINRDFKFPLSVLVGYLSLLLGCVITFVFQSSSAFTSALLPFAALGLLDLRRVYPLTLGSNVGTTATGIVAALAGDPVHRNNALQIALCHTFFNLIGILIFYPVPFFRFPLLISHQLGETGGKYRWFVLFYLATTFLLVPIAVLLLSFLGNVVFPIAMALIIGIFGIIGIINLLQRKSPRLLPVLLRNWNFLPLWMHSLDPMDQFFSVHLERIGFMQNFLNEVSFKSEIVSSGKSSSP